MFGRLFHQGLPKGVIRHRSETLAVAADYHKAALESGLLIRVGGNPGLEFCARQIGGVKAGSGRFGLAGQPGSVVVEAVPRAEHDLKHLEIGGV